MTDTRDLHDDALRTLVRAAGSPAGIDFRADLRARLAAAIDGDVELDPVEPADRRRTWLPIVTAAAVVALVVGTIAVIARERDPELGQAADLTTQLVGRTWVALDTPFVPQVLTLEFTQDTDGTLRLVGTANDGCNDVSGPFRLVDDVITSGEMLQTAMDCGPGLTAMLQPGTTRLTLVDAVLTLDDGERQTVYRALESLDPVSGAALDGLWASGPARIQIIDGEVTGSGPDGDPFPAELSDSLTAGIAEAWRYGETLIVRTPTTGLRRLDPAGPATAPLLDELVGRTWVGVGGEWQTAAPTLVFDSLNREPGLSAVSVFDGCNTGEGTFELDGATMVATEIGMSEAGCPHAVAGLADGTNLAVTDGANLAVTDTSGLTTFYVALDSLEPMTGTDLPAALDGVWEFAGSVFTIDGDMIRSHGSASTSVWELFSAMVRTTGVEAWRYDDGSDDGLVLRDGTTYVVLVRSDLPSGGSPVITTGPLSGGDEALILGTVTFEDDCLLTTLEGIRYPLVWQPGTSWDGRDTVILPDGVNLPMGQAIEAGGGYYAVDRLVDFGVEVAGIETMRGCADRIGAEIAVIQSPVTLQFPVESDG